MKNFIQPGDAMAYTNPGPGAIASGDPVLVVTRLGVASVNIAADAQGTLRLGGVFSLPKTTDNDMVQGDNLYWDAGAGELTLADGAGTNVLAGMCFAAAGVGAATVQCRLKG